MLGPFSLGFLIEWKNHDTKLIASLIPALNWWCSQDKIFMSYYANERAALGNFWAVRDELEEALTKIPWAYVIPVVYERFVIGLEMSKWEDCWCVISGSRL